MEIFLFGLFPLNIEFAWCWPPKIEKAHQLNPNMRLLANGGLMWKVNLAKNVKIYVKIKYYEENIEYVHNARTIISLGLIYVTKP